MKDAFIEKVTSVPLCAADSSEALAKLPKKETQGVTTSSGSSRKVYQSAAMIGLAISMGATGMLFSGQDDPVMAAEAANPDTNLTTLSNRLESQVNPPQIEVSSETEPVVSEMPSVPPVVASAAVEPALPVIKHEVKKGDTLWNLSQNYAVEPEAIAASNKIEPQAKLAIGQTVKIPTVNGIVHEVKTNETVQQLSKSYGVEAEQIQPSVESLSPEVLPVGTSVTIPGTVDQLLQKRQETALNNLKQKRDHLGKSLAELRSSNDTTSDQVGVKATEVKLEPKQEDISTYSPETALLPAEDQGVAVKVTQPVLIPISSLETAALPTSPIKEPAKSNQLIPVPVPLPKNPSARTPESEGTVVNSQSVSIPVSVTGNTLLPSSAQQKAEVINQPVLIPVPLPGNVINNNSQSFNSVETEKATISQLGVTQPMVLAYLPNQVHTVQAGDTLNGIARRYGISRDELMKANKIDNPNLIKLDQTLTIPVNSTPNKSKQSLTSIPSFNDSNIASSRWSHHTPVIEVKSSMQNELINIPVKSQIIRNEPIREDYSEVQSQNNLLESKFRTDITKIRQEYQSNTDVSEETTNASLPNPVSANQPVSIPVNSEWQKDWNQQDNNSDLTSDQPSNQSLNTTSEIKVEQPPQLLRNSHTASLKTPTRKPDIVASVPIEVENYNPSLQIPVGENVAPGYISPDPYQPSNPQTFNGYIWPTKGVISSGFGRRWGRMHKGIDIAAPIGTPVVAAAAGQVISAGWNSGGYGNLVKLQHADGSITFYAHNSRIFVTQGQEVEQGQQISSVGSTGHSTGPHLHFEVRPNGSTAVNPIAFLPSRR